MRHIAAAMAITDPSSASADRHPPTEAASALPPLTKRWPRMSHRGIEWTEVTSPATHSAMRVIRMLRPSPR